MKDFNDYTYATITEKENQEIEQLQNQIKSSTGEDVVLIAYQEKNKADLA